MGSSNAMLVAKKSVLFLSNKKEKLNLCLLSYFILTHDLVAVNTIFRKLNLISFYEQKTESWNYNLVRQKWCKYVCNCEIKLVTTVASDHNLVKADVK